MTELPTCQFDLESASRSVPRSGIGSTSLVSQGLYRIEPCGTSGREKPEDDAGESAADEGRRHGFRWCRCVDRSRGANDEGEPGADSETGDGTDQSQRHGL